MERWCARSSASRRRFEPRRDTAAEECARCNRLMPPWRHECEWCGLARDSIAARELADLAGSHRQLKRLLNTGAIANDAYQLLSAALKARHDELLGKPTAKPRPAAAAMATHTDEASEEILTVLPAHMPATIPFAPELAGLPAFSF